MIASKEPRPTELHFKNGSTGVLLIHGFTGSTTEMLLISNYYQQQGFTVLAPLLPGHGTNPEDLNTKRWKDWVRHVKESLDRLNSECQNVFVTGLSLGALLSLYLAANNTSVRGVVAYSPPLPIAHARSYLFPLKYLIPSLSKQRDYFADPDAEGILWKYSVTPLRAYFELLKFIRVVRAYLPKIHCPILVVYSTKDSIIHPKSADNVLGDVSSTQKDLLTLHKSGHVITLDAEWKQVAEKTVDFVKKY
jgi:carboxylesterase